MSRPELPRQGPPTLEWHVLVDPVTMGNMPAWTLTERRPTAVSLAGLAMLVLGLVGMHHLIAAQCHHATSISAVGSISTMNDDTPLLIHDEPELQPAPLAESQGRARGGAIPVTIALCLAILVTLLRGFCRSAHLRPPNDWVWHRPPPPGGRRPSSRELCLHMLSRSRT